jgi:hypothetical protein
VDGVQIGSWRENDGPALDKVLDETDALTGQFRPQRGPPTADPFRISFVARDESGPVGLATAFESRWHPQRLWVSVEVASSHRHRGVGSAMLVAIRAASGGKPLRAKVSPAVQQPGSPPHTASESSSGAAPYASTRRTFPHQ